MTQRRSQEELENPEFFIGFFTEDEIDNILENSIKDDKTIFYGYFNEKELFSISGLFLDIEDLKYELETLNIKTNYCAEIGASMTLKSARVHIEQSNESDLHFLKRLASDYNALFAIKNNTLIFKQKVKGDKKSDGLPRYSLNIKDISSYDIENTNKEKYNSCTASWHDTKENIQKSVTVGDGEPVKHIKGSYQNEADAKSKAQAALQKASSQTKVGNISCAGFVCYAGGVLNLSGTLEDDGEYHIKSVNHDIDTTAGWKISIEIEN